MILEMTDVCKDYFRGKIPVPVLKDINLNVEEGEYIAIMGPSGSGKTTLMNLVGCLDVPTSGTLKLNAVDVSTQTEDQLAGLRNSFIGFVFQQFHLLCPNEQESSELQKKSVHHLMRMFFLAQY